MLLSLFLYAHLYALPSACTHRMDPHPRSTTPHDRKQELERRKQSEETQRSTPEAAGSICEFFRKEIRPERCALAINFVREPPAGLECQPNHNGLTRFESLICLPAPSSVNRNPLTIRHVKLVGERSPRHGKARNAPSQGSRDSSLVKNCPKERKPRGFK